MIFGYDFVSLLSHTHARCRGKIRQDFQEFALDESVSQRFASSPGSEILWIEAAEVFPSRAKLTLGGSLRIVGRLGSLTGQQPGDEKQIRYRPIIAGQFPNLRCTCDAASGEAAIR